MVFRIVGRIRDSLRVPEIAVKHLRPARRRWLLRASMVIGVRRWSISLG
jgi:hypothetical protein